MCSTHIRMEAYGPVYARPSPDLIRGEEEYECKEEASKTGTSIPRTYFASCVVLETPTGYKPVTNVCITTCYKLLTSQPRALYRYATVVLLSLGNLVRFPPLPRYIHIPLRNSVWPFDPPYTKTACVRLKPWARIQGPPSGQLPRPRCNVCGILTSFR
jgi:hypothetical protein